MNYYNAVYNMKLNGKIPYNLKLYSTNTLSYVKYCRCAGTYHGIYSKGSQDIVQYSYILPYLWKNRVIVKKFLSDERV